MCTKSVIKIAKVTVLFVFVVISACHNAGVGSIASPNNIQNSSSIESIKEQPVNPYANAVDDSHLAKQPVASLKDHSNLYSNGSEANWLAQNFHFATSLKTGLQSPVILDEAKGSNIVACVYNSLPDTVWLVSTNTALGRKTPLEVLGHHYACLPEMVFDSSSHRFPIEIKLNANDKTGYITYLHQRDNSKMLNGDTDNQGYFAYQKDFKAQLTEASWQPDTDPNFTKENPYQDSGNGWSYYDDRITSNINYFTETQEDTAWWKILIYVVAAIIVVAALVATGVGILAVVNAAVASATIGGSVIAALVLGTVGIGAGITGIVLTANGTIPTTIYEDIRSEIPSKEYIPRPAPDSLFMMSLTETGNPEWYTDSNGEAISMIFTTDSHELKTLAGQELITQKGNDKTKVDSVYTNVALYCFGDPNKSSSERFNNCTPPGKPNTQVRDPIKWTWDKQLEMEKPAINVIMDASSNSKKIDIGQLVNDYKHKLEVATQVATKGIPGNWRNSHTRFIESNLTIVDDGDSNTGAIQEVFNYNYCKFGTGVNYAPIPKDLLQDKALPIGAYRTLCKDIAYDANSGLISGKCPSVSANNLTSPVLQQVVSLVGPDCKELSINNGKFECVDKAKTGDLSDFPLLARAAGQCDVTVTSPGRWGFRCADPDTLQMGKVIQMNKSTLINNSVDFVYEPSNNTITILTTTIAAGKALVCDEYALDPATSIRPGDSILLAYGAKFLSETFEPTLGKYSYTYQDKLNNIHSLNLNVYKQCSKNVLATELGVIPGSNPQAVQFELHCLVPESGPRLLSSVVENTDKSSVYFFDPYSGLLVLESKHNKYTYEPVMLSYLEACRWGSPIAIEDLPDKNRIVHRVFTCSSQIGAFEENGKLPTNGNYKATCANPYYQVLTGYLQAICSKSDSTKNVSRVYVGYGLDKITVNNINGNLTLVK